MNHVIAYQLLLSELNSYRDLGYGHLLSLLGEKTSFRKIANDGNQYEVSIRVSLQPDEQGNIRVMGMVGPTVWGSPHDSVEDAITVSRSLEQDT